LNVVNSGIEMKNPVRISFDKTEAVGQSAMSLDKTSPAVTVWL